MSVCDWWSKWRYDRALKRGMAAMDRRDKILSEFTVQIVGDRGEGSIPAPKPDTVESVLNQFISLGHDKPEVVIKGEIYHGGDARYKATIDGSKVYRRGAFVWLEHFDSIEQAEYAVTDSLRVLLNRVPVEEIEITY